MICKIQPTFPLEIAEKYFSGDNCLQQFNWLTGFIGRQATWIERLSDGHALVVIEAVTGRCFFEKYVLKSFAKFTGTRMCWSLIFNKIAGIGIVATLLKKDSNIGFLRWILRNF